MDWTDESANVPEPIVDTDHVAPNPAGTAVTQHTFARVAAAFVLVLAIALGGFAVGHYVDSPQGTSSAVPRYPQGQYPDFGGGFGGGFAGGFGNGFGSGASVTPSLSNGTAATAKVAKRVDAGLVDITSTYSSAGSTGEGTGMILTSTGVVLTNNHVIEGATSISVRDVKTGATYRARVLGYDVARDVALLQLIDASGLTTVTTDATSTISAGEKIIGVGNAEGAGGTPSYTAGTVVATNQSITAQDESNPSGAEQLKGLVEVDADVLPGDSGGSLVNSSGQVIAMVTAGSSANGGFGFTQGASGTSQGYAIPIATALRIAEVIESGHSAPNIHVGKSAFLGVEFDSTASTSNAASGSSVSGVTIATAIAGDPAAQAGLVAGDVITSVNGQTVTTGTSLQSIMITLRPGQSVSVGYVNAAGQDKTVTVVLGSGPPQ